MATVSALGGELNILARHSNTIGPYTSTLKEEDGTALNLTGASFSSTIKELNGTIVDSFDITTPDLAGGTFVFSLPFSRCANLVNGTKYLYSLEMTLDGVKRPLLYGTIELRALK